MSHTPRIMLITTVRHEQPLYITLKDTSLFVTQQKAHESPTANVVNILKMKKKVFDFFCFSYFRL